MNKNLILWSKNHYSHLPWRVNRSVYNTLVSEIMLQQTTVSTVINHFDRFISKYPDIDHLASCSEEQILIDWKGLGYYRRAKNLLKAAKQIKDEFNSIIPDDIDTLLKINGIGPYTASALRAIGNNKRALAVDANLERVLARFYGIKINKGPKLQKEIYSLFENKNICDSIEKIGPRDFNEALMDLGRSVCSARKAFCDLCPLRDNCKARIEGDPLSYPLISETQKKKKSSELKLIRFIVEKDNKILGKIKSDTQWLSGQKEIPTYVLHCSEEGFSQYPKLEAHDFDLLDSFKSAITHYKITNHVMHISFKEFSSLPVSKDYEFYNIENENWSTSTIKALKL